MQGDKDQPKVPVGVPTGTFARKEVGLPGIPIPSNEIIQDKEVRDSGVVETPAPEFAPPVQISDSQTPAPVTSRPASTVQAVPEAEVKAEKEPEIPKPSVAAQILKVNEEKIPLKTQSSEVYQADVVDREDKKLPEAA